MISPVISSVYYRVGILQHSCRQITENDDTVAHDLCLKRVYRGLAAGNLAPYAALWYSHAIADNACQALS
jgi:hypothetical protein